MLRATADIKLPTAISQDFIDLISEFEQRVCI